jgi:hypothetical protein
MNLKRVRKRDLCSLIRYLNFYHLNRDRIHYFSIRVKEDLVHDLAKIYEITEDETGVYFKATAVRLPDFRYRLTDDQWFKAGTPVKLPRSRKECSRRLNIVRTRTVLTF